MNLAMASKGNTCFSSSSSPLSAASLARHPPLARTIRARIRHFSQIPENMPQHITDKLTERLKLDSAQQQQVLAVLTNYDARLTQTREQSRAMFDALMQEMTVQIDQYLTPAQILEHKKMLDELEQRRRDNRALMRAYPPPPPVPTNSAKK